MNSTGGRTWHTSSERGATSTEYGLLVLFIAFALVTGVTAFGMGLDQAFDDLAGWIHELTALST